MLASLIQLCPVLFSAFAFGVLTSAVGILLARRFQARCAADSFNKGFDRLTQDEIDHAKNKGSK